MDFYEFTDWFTDFLDHAHAAQLEKEQHERAHGHSGYFVSKSAKKLAKRRKHKRRSALARGTRWALPPRLPPRLPGLELEVARIAATIYV